MNFSDFMHVWVSWRKPHTDWLIICYAVTICQALYWVSVSDTPRDSQQGGKNVNVRQSIISCWETASRREGTDGEPPVCQEWRPLLGTGRKLRSMFWWSPERWCCESAALNMPANLENSAVATGLEKVSFHSNPKERQGQRMLHANGY